MDRVLIYGLGNDGKSILESMAGKHEVLGISIVGLMDRAKQENNYPYILYEPDCINQLQYDYILVTSEKYYEEIRDGLVNTYSVPPQRIILWKNWIYGRGKSRYYCNVCRNHLPLMLKYNHKSPVYVQKKIIGGGMRDAARCPVCGSLDRNRWVMYVLENKTGLFHSRASILHFAPEKGIETRIRETGNGQYITADIEAGKADRVMDITNIPFPDKSFDFIICNHVLEHIKEETKALSELQRCLKDEGSIIFSVPICCDQNTLEDDGIDTSEKRLQFYGQEDHVRLYGNDLPERLMRNGFRVKRYQVKECLSEEEIERMSLIPEDLVWILEKGIR